MTEHPFASHIARYVSRGVAEGVTKGGGGGSRECHTVRNLFAQSMDEFIFNCTSLSASSSSCSVDFPCTQHMHLSVSFFASSSSSSICSANNKTSSNNNYNSNASELLKVIFACRIRIPKTELNNSAKRISGLIDWAELQSSGLVMAKAFKVLLSRSMQFVKTFLEYMYREWLKSMNG